MARPSNPATVDEATIDEKTGPSTLLESSMPRYERSGCVAVRVHASPHDVFRALREVTPADVPFAGLLGKLRFLPGRLPGGRRAGEAPAGSIVEQLLDGGNVVLAERQDREIVLGSIGKFHRVLDREPVPLDGVAHFNRFRDPAYQKLAVSLRVEPDEDALRLTLEHRTHAMSAASRWALLRHWLLSKLVGSFVFWLVLRAIGRRAETNARARHVSRSALVGLLPEQSGPSSR